MMKKFLIRYISPLFLVLSLFQGNTPVSAQGDGEADMLSKAYVDSYDSLISGYYMRKYNHNIRRHARANVDFDNVSDSLLAHRLAALHTVIPMDYNNVVRSYIKMYLNKMSSRLDVMLTLGDFYYPMFEEVLCRYGVPEELKYLTIVESAMNPMATSRAGAAGLWQFMYHTGKNYDMEVNSVVDDRRDPYKSTVAAARYLHDLHSVYNDWTLAIAAYNCGPGNINKAIARSGGLRNYWQIYPYLPRETRGYIPAFIAAIYVMNYYPEHGLRPSKFSLPIHSDTLTMKNEVLFCYVSEFTGVSMEELRVLNPQYRVDYIPSGGYTLALPTNKLELMIRYEDSIYRRTADSLEVKPVEVATVQQPASKGSRGGGGGGGRHTVKKGETLSSIARKYGTTVQALKKKNKIKGDKICVGQRIKL